MYSFYFCSFPLVYHHSSISSFLFPSHSSTTTDVLTAALLEDLKETLEYKKAIMEYHLLSFVLSSLYSVEKHPQNVSSIHTITFFILVTSIITTITHHHHNLNLLPPPPPPQSSPPPPPPQLGACAECAARRGTARVCGESHCGHAPRLCRTRTPPPHTRLPTPTLTHRWGRVETELLLSAE